MGLVAIPLLKYNSNIFQISRGLNVSIIEEKIITCGVLKAFLGGENTDRFLSNLEYIDMHYEEATHHTGYTEYEKWIKQVNELILFISNVIQNHIVNYKDKVNLINDIRYLNKIVLINFKE